MEDKRIGVIVGSLRKESYSRKIARELMKLAPKSIEMEEVEIGGLSIYNQDFDDDPPSAWEAFSCASEEI